MRAGLTHFLPPRLRVLSLPFGIIVVALLLASWFASMRPRALPSEPAEKVWAVPVKSISAVAVQPQIVAFGQVQAAREAELRALVSGRLVSLEPDFRDGALLASGQELARIDPVDYENRLAEKRAELERIAALLQELRGELKWEQNLADNAERQVELARRSLGRTEELARSGRESKRARDEDELALFASQQSLMLRQQAVARLKTRIAQQVAQREQTQVALAAAERELAHTRVIAPFAGYVTEVRLALGQLVSMGEKLGRLLSQDQLEVRFELPERDFARILEAEGEQALIGRPLVIVWRVGEAVLEFAGELTRTGAEIDPSLGGIEVFATLDSQASTRGLRAGAFVEIQVPDVAYENVFRVPERALDNENAVYQLVGERLNRVAVKPVRDLGEDLLVRGDIDPAYPLVTRTFAGIGPGLLARAL